MENRDKILEELKNLKAEGVQIRIVESSQDGYITAGMAMGGQVATAVQRAREKMVIAISEKDDEEKIMEKIGEAKKAVEAYKKIVEHDKSTPDFLNYLRNNLFVD